MGYRDDHMRRAQIDQMLKMHGRAQQLRAQLDALVADRAALSQQINAAALLTQADKNEWYTDLITTIDAAQTILGDLRTDLQAQIV